LKPFKSQQIGLFTIRVNVKFFKYSYRSIIVEKNHQNFNLKYSKFTQENWLNFYPKSSKIAGGNPRETTSFTSTVQPISYTQLGKKSGRHIFLKIALNFIYIFYVF
jgi:hypothetical protein